MANDLPALPKTAYEQLKRRHQRFVDALVDGKSVAEAMRIIGNKSKHARIIGHRWMHEPDIQAAKEERTRIAIHDAGANAVSTMRQMAAIASSDVRNLTNPDGSHKAPHELDDATAWAVRSIEVEEVSTGGREGTRYKYQFWDKPKANEFLGKVQKLIEPAGPTVNVDARSVTVNATGGAEALQGALRLLEQARSIAAPVAAAVSDQDGLVLPAAVRDEPPRRRASLDAGEDT